MIVDISNKAAPTLAGSYTVGGIWDVSVLGNYAYVGNLFGGLMIIDISNKEASVLAGSYDTAGYAYGVFVSDNYAYVASNDLAIVDISNKEAPVLSGHCYIAGGDWGVSVLHDFRTNKIFHYPK